MSNQASSGDPSAAIIHTHLENGNPVCIRRIQPSDEGLMREGIARMSPRSRYLRFFSGASTVPDWVIDRLLATDGHGHLAWGAIDTSQDRGTAIGAVHAIRPDDTSDCAEFSVAILDDYHGLGLGKLLTATILLDGASDGLNEFQVNTLSENDKAMAFVQKLGGVITSSDGPDLEYRMNVTQAIANLHADCDPPGMRAVFSAFE